jgi:hypothetical protein
MAGTPGSESGLLQDLLGQVPDRHHALGRGQSILSVNGRHPAPLQLWQPDYCGDIDMAISSDGTWYHEGVPIKRPELWQLFSGILRREADGDYYLVTPVEKCRVDVALHPLMITDMQVDESGEGRQLLAVLNAGGVFPVSREYPLKLEAKAGGAAYIELPHGLSALCSRAAWYRLVDLADDRHSVTSGGAKFFLG